MKKRSLFKILNFRLFIIIFFSFILLLSIFFDIYYFYDFYFLFENTKKIFTKINKFFSSGNFNEELFNDLKPYYNTDSLKKFYYRAEKEKLADELRLIVKTLQDKRENYLYKILIINRAIFLILFITILIIYFIIFNLNKYFRKNLYFANYIVEYIDNLIHFSSEKKEEKNPIINFFLNYRETHYIIKKLETLKFIINIFNELIKMDITLSIEQFIDNFGKIICDENKQNLFKCDRFSLAVYEKGTDNIVAYHAYTNKNVKNIYLKRGFTQKLKDTSLKKIIDEKKDFRIIEDLTSLDTESSNLLKEEGIKSNLTIPIIINNKLLGFLFFASTSRNSYNEINTKFALTISNFIKSRLFYSFADQQIIKILGDSIINTVEYKDEETYKHTIRVSMYSEIISDYLAEKGIISPQKAREIRDFSPLHDIGKIGIPDNILLKPSKLTEEEFKVIKEHTIIGAKIIDSSNKKIYGDLGYKLLDTAFNIVIDHHENFDGTGYPFNKKEEQISIEGRITGIADVFDALTTKRPYKEPIPFDESIQIMLSLRGTKFDPFLLDIFLEKINEVKHIYEMLKD